MKYLLILVFSMGLPEFVLGRQYDSLLTEARPRNLVEIGMNSLGIGVGYSFLGNKYFSLDVVASGYEPAIAVGASFRPFQFLFVRGLIGTHARRKAQAVVDLPFTGDWDGIEVVDGFPANLVTGWSVGMLLPLGHRQERFGLSFSMGYSSYALKGARYLQ